MNIIPGGAQATLHRTASVDLYQIQMNTECTGRLQDHLYDRHRHRHLRSWTLQVLNFHRQFSKNTKGD